MEPGRGDAELEHSGLTNGKLSEFGLSEEDLRKLGFE